MWTESQELRPFVAGYLALLPLKKAAVEIDKRFVECLLESDGVTGRIIEVLRRAAFQASADKSQRVGLSSSNTWELVCHQSAAEGRDFSFRTLLKARKE